MRKLLLLAFFAMFLGSSHAQVVFQSIGSPVYDFLDEMANMGYIDLNSAVKPYSRDQIALHLANISLDNPGLNKRQEADLEFYLKDFKKDILSHTDDFDRRRDLFYHDSKNFKFTLNPIIGGKLMMNDSGSVFRRWNGAEAWAYAGDHIGFYTSLRDNGTSDILAEYSFLVNETGGNYKLNQDGQINGRSDWSEMKGGITYSWDWGSIGLVKDDRVWGNNYNGANIFSNRNPSYAAIQFKVNPGEWFDFNYIHGWLVSEVLDSTRTLPYPVASAATCCTTSSWPRICSRSRRSKK